jgi:excisionase family DNA binding protein
MAEREWLTTGEAARLLGVSRDTIRRMCANGQIPGAERFGAATKRQPNWRIPSSAVRRLRKENHR